MLKAIILCVLVSLTLSQPSFPDFGLLSDDEINHINNVARTTWKAGRNFHPDLEEYVKRLAGTKYLKEIIKGPQVKIVRKKRFAALSYPATFDARTKWPNCKSLQQIKSQGACNNGWAVNTAAMINDKICIKSVGKTIVNISSDDMLVCCKFCGFPCQYGWPEPALDYYHKHGVVTGGDYNSKKGCRPYMFSPCNHNISGSYTNCTNVPYPSTICGNQTCFPGYPKTYKQDKHYGSESYHLSNYNIDDVMQDLYENGPLVANLAVYSDFFQYKTGIYEHKSGVKLLGKQTVKVIGWGIEDDVKYWLCANSWNTEWGDKGFFKVVRGVVGQGFVDFYGVDPIL